MKNLIYDRTTVYNIGYHMVWSVKYRRPILTDQIEVSLREFIFMIAEQKSFVIKELEIMPDHVHIFVSAKPKVSPSYIYKMLKGISGRWLFMKYPDIKSKLWKGHLWNPSTYVETVGHISEDTIKKYIQGQKKQ